MKALIYIVKISIILLGILLVLVIVQGVQTILKVC